MISLLADNTVLTPDENVNSSHSHKALTEQTKAIADGFPYLGATAAGEGEELLMFNGHTINGIACFDDISEQSERFQLFASFVFTDELRTEVQAEIDAAEADRLKKEALAQAAIDAQAAARQAEIKQAVDAALLAAGVTPAVEEPTE